MPSKNEISINSNLDLKKGFTTSINNYVYNSQDSLVAWFDLGENVQDLSNNSDDISSANYRTDSINNNPDAVLSTDSFNDSNPSYPEYNVARFNPFQAPTVAYGGKRNVKIIYSSHPTPVTFGSSSGDSPFSVSIWARVNPDSTGAPGFMFAFGNQSTTAVDYNVYWGTNYLYFQLYDDSSPTGNIGVRIELTDYTTTYSDWHHYTFTYNGDESFPSLRIYINGELQSTEYVSGHYTYAGMGATTTTEFTIGSNGREFSQWQGFLSQVAVFDTELDQENINAIYEGTSIGGTYAGGTGFYSGTVSNPVKDVIKTLDSRIKNIHDCGVRKSTQKINFNDLDTIDFVERELIGSIGVEEGKTSTPYVALNSYEDYGIKVTSKFDSTRTTNQVRNTFEGDIDPFNEFEKIYLTPEQSSSKDISVADMEDQRGLHREVSSKDIIEIDLRPVEPTTFGIEQGVGNSNKNDLMVYWNDKLKKWEKTGGTYLKPPGITSMLESSKIGFAPTSGFVLPGSKDNFRAAFNNWGMHVDNFGFPRHPKFQAGSNQYIKVSDYICEPFLLEYIAYEFDSVMHVDEATSAGYAENKTNTNFTKTDTSLSAYTFFILNERPDHQYKESFFSKIKELDGSTYTREALIDDDYYDNRTTRELIAKAQAVIYKNPPKNSEDEINFGNFDKESSTQKYENHSGFLAEGVERALNITGSNFIDSGTSFNDSNYAHSGSAILFARVDEDPSHESYGMTLNAGGTKMAITDLGAYRQENLEEKISPRGFSNGLKINQKNANVHFHHTLFQGNGLAQEEGVTVKKTYFSDIQKPNPQVIMPGDRLILGWQTPVPFDLTMLSDTNPSSQMTINTRTGKLKLYGSFISNKKAKNAETIFYQNNHISRAIGCCLSDQFQIESRNYLKYSYPSYSFSGNHPERESTKRESSSTTVKSSIHFTNHMSDHYVYDSYIPDLKDYSERMGFSLDDNTYLSVNLGLALDGHNVYAPSYGVNGSSKRSKFSKISFRRMSSQDSRIRCFSKSYSVLQESEKNPGTYITKTDGVTGSKTINYGLYSYNLSRQSAQFNTRHFGHYSDIIEQRKMFAYEIKGEVIYPLEVRFFKDDKKIDPIESTSQNIYPHAESYLPFYDGEDTVTFRPDDTSLIDDISISTGMLDEIILKDSQIDSLQKAIKIIK